VLLSVRINPPVNDPNPDAMCCTAELTPMNPPRNRLVTVEVMIAIAGTNRPDMQIMNNVVTAIAVGVPTRGKCVSRSVAPMAHTAMIVKRRRFP
jgi:hypothetical protein